MVAIVAMIGLGTLPAIAVDIRTINGTVRDPAGTPLSGVRVAYTTRSTYTDALGKYSIGFSNTGTYALTASRSDLNPQTKNVNVVTQIGPVDFSLTYVLVGAIDDSAFNTLPKTLTLTAASTAPSSSCATATVQPSGTVVPLAFTTTSPDGTNNWAGTYTVPSGTDDGSYAISYKAVQCSGGLLLTNLGSQTYALDRVAPIIDPRTLTPLDHGNTIFSSQRVLAKISDDRSGVDPASIQFTVEDTTTGSSNSYSGSAVSYTPSTFWAKTAPAALILGHIYRATVSVQDLAGNEAVVSQDPESTGGGFLASGAALRTAKASIPSTTCTLSAVNATTGMKTATCRSVPLHLDSTSVTLNGTRHAGIGYVEQTVSLQTAKLKTTIAGLPVSRDAYNAGDPAWSARRLSTQFVTRQSGAQSQTIIVPEVEATMGTLTGTVPATWSSATLEMPPVNSAPTSAACSDPSTAPVACVPDPLRFYLGDEWATQIAADHEAQQKLPSGFSPSTGMVESVALNYFSIWVPETQVGPVCIGAFCLTRNVAPGHWEAVLPIGGCLNTTCAPCPDGNADCFLQYAEGYPAVSPAAYGPLCAANMFDCVSVDSESAAQSESKPEYQYNNTLVEAEHFDWDTGFCFLNPDDPVGCDDGDAHDFHHFAGYAYIGLSVRDPNPNGENAGIPERTICDDAYDPSPPFNCYGFYEGADTNQYDGVGAGWKGQWRIPHISGDPFNQYRWFWVASARQFCRANRPTFSSSPWIKRCFDYSNGWDGQYYQFNQVNYDVKFARWYGECPLDWTTCGPGRIVVESTDTWSGALKFRSHGYFARNQPTSQSYNWTNYIYAIGADIYQDDDATTQNGVVSTLFTHHWTESEWTFQPTCSYPGGCRWTYSTQETGHDWSKPDYLEYGY